MTDRRVEHELLRETYLQVVLRAARERSAGLDETSRGLADLDYARRQLGMATTDEATSDRPGSQGRDPVLAELIDAVADEVADNANRLLRDGGEIPEEVGQLLDGRGWSETLSMADAMWDDGASSFGDQPAPVQGARIGFLRALVEVLLPDELLDDIAVSWANIALPGTNGPLKGDLALQRAVRLMRGIDIAFPEVPSHVVPYITSSEGLFLGTAGVPFDPYAGYGLDFGGPEVTAVPASYLRSDLPDYVLTGGRNSGYSTSWGFVIRGGGVFAAVQYGIWSVAGDQDSDPAVPRFANAIVESFNRLVAPLMDRGRRPLTVGVLYSSYRNYAAVVTTDRSAWIEADDGEQGLELPRVWGFAMLGEPRPGTTVPAIVPESASEELEAAMQFLAAALQAKLERRKR